MTIISTREFRANQGKYMDMASKGSHVVLRSKKHGSFKLVPITEDDSLMSEEDFFAKITKSQRQYEEHPETAIVMGENETGEHFINRILGKCSK